MKSDDRRLKILEYVIDQYIRTGEPVSSQTVTAMLGHTVSPATVRNDMATLERLGFLEQPHTSAGRVPSYRGYHMYITQLMTPSDLTPEEKEEIDQKIENDASSASAVFDNALSALAEITGCAVVGKTDLPKFSVITKVEVVPAGRRLYALLLITSAGEVKNKICRLQFDLTDEQISFFEDLVNKELSGEKISEINPERLQDLAVALGSYMLSLSPLLYTLYQLSDEMTRHDVKFTGETNLMQCGEFSADELVQFMSTKEEIANILSSALDGVNVVFGKETGTLAITNSSLILSKNQEKESLGTFGIIGPIRIDYAKVIPYVEYFSQSVGRVLQGMLDDDEKGDQKDEKG